jgi:hypothetical protein
LKKSIEIPELVLPDIPGMIKEAVDDLPKPENGKSVTVEEVTPLIESLVNKAVEEFLPITELIYTEVEKSVSAAVAKLPVAKDGVGVAGAVIDRNNHLVLTLSNGDVKNLGLIVGQDADMKELRQLVKSLVDEIPRPADGLGFDDLSMEYDGHRGFTVKFTRGDQVKEFSFNTPHMIYRGVYRPEDLYEKGDAVTLAGSLWHCNKDGTASKPGDDADWTLAVKRGRDGKESVKTIRDPDKPVNKNG